MTNMKRSLVPLLLVLQSSQVAYARIPQVESGDALTTTSMEHPPAVIGMELINTRTDKVLLELTDGAVVYLDTLGLPSNPRLSVRAVVAPSTDVDLDETIGSVAFDWNGDNRFRVENEAPYSLCGDKLGVYKVCRGLGLATHSVTATPYTKSRGRGDAGDSLSMSFTLVESQPIACSTPQFVGKWERATPYPSFVAEAQGGMIGEDFLLFGGFDGAYEVATAKTFALNTSDDNAIWRPMDDFPIREGITHAAFAISGTKLYACGGYKGGHPGPHIPDCFVYDNSVSPGTSSQWSRLPDLPEARGGGGLVYDSIRRNLLYSGGAERPVTGAAEPTIDYEHTWSLSLIFPNTAWISKKDLPFPSNHMTSITAFDKKGKERHYFIGGQLGNDEFDGNVDSNYEWHSERQKWIQRSPLPFPRGHTTASTRAISCGFILAGGSSNDYGKLSDVSYYATNTDSWESIGKLPGRINTPVCDFRGEWLYCESGFTGRNFSWRRRIFGTD